jgi:hypothetical protein
MFCCEVRFPAEFIAAKWKNVAIRHSSLFINSFCVGLNEFSANPQFDVCYSRYRNGACEDLDGLEKFHIIFLWFGWLPTPMYYIFISKQINTPNSFSLWQEMRAKACILVNMLICKHNVSLAAAVHAKAFFLAAAVVPLAVRVCMHLCVDGLFMYMCIRVCYTCACMCAYSYGQQL